MFSNRAPFIPAKPSIPQQVAKTLHLPHKQTPVEKSIHWLQHLLLYVCIFTAGYVVAKLQTFLVFMK